MGMRGRGFGPRELGLARLLSDPDIRQQVGISADQVAKIKQQESDFRKAEIRDRAELQVKRIELRDLLSADQPDRAAIDSKLQEISAAQLTLEKAAVDNRLNMRQALTPAQRDKLRQLMRQRRHPEAGGNAGARGPRRGGTGQRRAAPQPKPQAQGQTPNQQPNQ
jgi:Heavy-metal resistance